MRLKSTQIYKMKKIQLLLVALASIFYGNAQVQVCLGTDATVCQGQTVQITNCGSGGGSAGGINLNNPSSVSLGDDQWSGAINMGFTFSYYGSNYTQCVIGSNGVISFNLANAGGYCPWSLTAGQTIPNSGIVGANNSSMICYGDLYPTGPTSGPIQYQTIGTAPNRQFVVLYNGVTMYGCTSQCVYVGYVFYENTNVIEHFIGSKTICSTWNSGLAIQGNQNSPGNTAVAVAGRNNTVWTANQDGRRFSPTSAVNTSNYTVTQIPYQTINTSGAATTQWQNTLGQTFPYNSGVLQINQVLPGTTGYFLTGTSCGVSVGAVSDTTWITRVSVNGTATATTDYCNGGSGTATANPTAGGTPFTYLWNPTGQTTQTAVNLVAGPYTVTITDINGCTKNVNITVPNSTATYSATSTLVSCPGGSDGTATATMTPVLGTVTYNWYDAGGQTTQTATGLSAGLYHCEVVSSTGCIDTVDVTVTEIPGMVAQIVNFVDATCNSGSDGIVTVSVANGTPIYSYAWDNSSSTSATANDLPAGTHTVTITDANNCVITATQTIGEPNPLNIISLTPDLVICPENSTNLTVQGAGGSSPYIFTWKENGSVIGTGSTITVDPVNSGTQYCVTISEQCGSPTKDSCMTITFPTPIVPNFTTDIQSSCQPGIFNYFNNSNNINEIATVEMSYGDTELDTLIGGASSVHTFPNPGKYSLDVIVTSIYGCVYTGSFPDIVEVIEIPTAEFNMSANPTTIFETTVKMQDNSSATVVNWQWSSPGSVPNQSSTQNPVFNFPEGVVASYDIQLIVKTAEGCIDTVYHTLFVNSDILFFAPNAFTPDGDEFNQSWAFSVSGIDVYNFELLIYNRWGELIWETHDPTAEWDGTYHGKIVPAGSYSWIARVKDIYTDKKKEFKGDINILR